MSLNIVLRFSDFFCNLVGWVPAHLLGLFSGLGLNVFYFGLADGCRCLELIRGTSCCVLDQVEGGRLLTFNWLC